LPIDHETARLRASIGANARWAAVADRNAATAPARRGFFDKLEREAREKLGPEATDQQVARAADNALKAHYARMQMNSLIKRRKAAEERRTAIADAVIEAAPNEAA